MNNLSGKNKIPFSLEEIPAYHSRLMSENYSNIDSVLSQLVPYYLSLPLKSPLKKPLRVFLKEADLRSSLLPYLSGVVTERAAAPSEDLFSVVEECIESLPGGLKCVENNLHAILYGMNKLFIVGMAEPRRGISLTKSYHKTIAKCHSVLQECLANSVTQEYQFIRDNLTRLSTDCGLSDLDLQGAGSQIFGGIVKLMRSEEEETSQTAIFVIILLMQSLTEKEEFLQDIEVIINSLESKIHVYNLRIMFGIFSTSPSDILFITPENKSDPVFVEVAERIHRSLSTEQHVWTRLLLCRCLHACISALSRSPACPLYRGALVKYLAAMNGFRETIVGIVMNNWDSYSELIRQQIKSIFEDFLVLLSLVFHSDSQKYFEELASRFLLLDARSRAKYKYLSLLSNYIPLSRWSALDPLLPDSLPSLMDECALASHAGEFWSRLVSRESLHFPDVQPWIDSLLSTISRVSGAHSRNIFNYCKKGLISSHPEILQYLSSHTPATDQGLLFLVQCHQQAQKQLTNCQMISSEQLSFSLNSSSSDLAISVLELISKSHKSTAIVSENHLNLVLKGLTLLMCTSSTSCRKKLTDTFKVLIDRIEKSSYKFIHQIKGDDSSCCISHYSSFLSRCSSFLFSCLSPASPNGVIEVALSLLNPVMRLYLSHAKLFPPDFSINDLDLERLMSALKDTYDSHCRMALDALLVLRDRVSIWLSFDSNYDILLDEMFSLMLSPVSVHSTSASYFLRLLFIIEPCRLCDSIRSKYPLIPRDPYAQDRLAPVQVDCSVLLMELLALQLQNSRDRWDPIQHCFYSILRCIRRLLIDDNSLSSCPSSILEHCFDRLTSLCSEVLEITGPIVCCSSPEGALQPPSNATGEGNCNYDGSKALLLCAWQSLKEISLLYSEIVELVIPSNRSLCDSRILNRIYDFFLNYLMEARHRGAFELTYFGFSKLCRVLWLSCTENINSLPSTWLKSVLNSLSSKENESTQLKLLSCATRRSAGLPFLVLAVLANEPKHLRNKHLLLTMDTLSALAANTLSSPEDTIVKVHCLNILRALFKDSQLRNSMHQFVAGSIRLVLACVASRHWPVRNASHLLLSSVLARVFGVKRMQDEHAWQNKLTANAFFARYSHLMDVFIQKLNKAARNPSEIQSDSSVFLILTILSRLYIGKSEVGSLSGNAFIPPLLSLSESPSWKLREMCARAACSLLSCCPFLDLLATLRQHWLTLSDSSPQNRLHGFLLILKELIQTRYSQLSFDETKSLFAFCIELIPKCSTGVTNHSFLMQIISAMLSRFSPNLLAVLTTSLDYLCSYLSTRLKEMGNIFWENNLLMQTQISSNVGLALTLLNKLNFKQHLQMNDLVSIVAHCLDRPDTRHSCIQSMIEQPIHSLNGFPLFNLFPLLITPNKFQHIKCLKAILLIHDYNLEALAHELSETPLDLKGALGRVLPSSGECLTDDPESASNSIMFAGSLLLALNSQRQVVTGSFGSLIRRMYETAIEFQDPTTLELIASTASSIYSVIVSQHLETRTLKEWYFLLLYIIQQNKSTQKLSSLVISSYQNSTHISHSDLPPNPHPSILTELLMESVAPMQGELQAMHILLFLLANYPAESESGAEEEREPERVFEETTQSDGGQPDVVLSCVLRAIEKLVSASQEVEVLVETVNLNYREYQKQVADGDTSRLRWNRKDFLTNLKCSFLGYILNKWMHCMVTPGFKASRDECCNMEIKYLAFYHLFFC